MDGQVIRIRTFLSPNALSYGPFEGELNLSDALAKFRESGLLVSVAIARSLHSAIRLGVSLQHQHITSPRCRSTAARELPASLTANRI